MVMMDRLFEFRRRIPFDVRHHRKMNSAQGIGGCPGDKNGGYGVINHCDETSRKSEVGS
jgi:hypothetical protein